MKNQNAGAKSKAFTLVELLVVVAIIALLLAILVPGLQKAKELSYRIKCGSNLRNILNASGVYSDTFDNYFLPGGRVGGNKVKTWNEYQDTQGDKMWQEIGAFHEYLGLNDYSVSGNDWSMPKEFICPADRINRGKAEDESRTSYGFNNQDWLPWSHAYLVVGHRADGMKRPAETLYFVDSVVWWVDLNGAHYVYVWDVAKNYYVWEDVPEEQRWGAVFYRHNEGAICGFYDGHTEWMDKTEIFNREGYNSRPCDAGIWTETGTVMADWYPKKRYSN